MCGRIVGIVGGDGSGGKGDPLWATTICKQTPQVQIELAWREVASLLSTEVAAT